MLQEVESKEDKTALSPQQRVESLSQRTPSGPDFAQATAAYCNECVEACIAKFGEVLMRHFPEVRQAIESKLQIITQPGPRRPPQTSFVTEGDRKLLEFPNGSRLFLNRIAESVYYANPELGVLQYIVSLYPPRNQQETYQRFPWFENRFTKIVEVGQFSLDDPRVEYIAVGYVTQVGKVHATNKARELLKRAQPFAGVGSAEGAMLFLDTIADAVKQIRGDQLFIARGLATMVEIGERVGFDDQQTQLLLDLAFIRNRAFDQPAEFRQALEPILRLIAEENWEEAFAHRDFLLRYFSNSFPAWRVREFRATGAATFESFKDLARAVVQHRLVMYDEEVPDQYKASFGSTFPKKIERAQRERNEAIVRRSVRLSNTIVKELAAETQEMVRFRFFREFSGEREDEVRQIFTSPLSELTKSVKFRTLCQEIDPDATDAFIRNFYDELKERFSQGPIIVEGPPYTIRTPFLSPILTVEFMDDRQVYWYQTTNIVDVRLRGGDRVPMMKNYGNFGRLLHNLILKAHQETPERPVLNLEEIKAALQRAYEKERQHDPIVAQFTLGDYLRALFSTVDFAVELTDIDPVIKFTRELA